MARVPPMPPVYMTTARCLTGRVQQLIMFTSSATRRLNMDFPWCGNCWHSSLHVALIWICKFFQMSSCEWHVHVIQTYSVLQDRKWEICHQRMCKTHICKLRDCHIQGMYPANRNKLMIMIILSMYIYICLSQVSWRLTHTHTHSHIKSQTHRLCFKDVLPEF